MKLYGIENYLQLYKMLCKAQGSFTLTLPDGYTYDGRAANPELCAALFRAGDKTGGTLSVKFDNNLDVLRSIDYITGLKRA